MKINIEEFEPVRAKFFSVKSKWVKSYYQVIPLYLKGKSKDKSLLSIRIIQRKKRIFHRGSIEWTILDTRVEYMTQKDGHTSYDLVYSIDIPGLLKNEH